ncbi:hypothetical protein M9435_000015 [Picochlorum sp. BPE23]|nr:hypothetical protein M9435_000015 [Picochlorum sp. BPE23]
MAEQSAACHCTCCRKNSRSSLELRELHARTLSEMRGSISSLTTKYKSTLEAMETLKRESEENRRLSAMAANSAQIHCDEIKNGLQAMSLDANELVQILSTELSSVKEDRDKLRRNQDVLCSKLSSMSQPGVEERAVLVGEIQDLTRSRETLQVSISNLRTKCSDLEATVASLQEENARLMQREATDAPAVEGLRTKCSDLEATVASLQEENAQLMQREATDAPAVEGLRTKCSDLEATVASLQEENARLLQREATDAPAVEGLRTKCSDLEATVASLQEENAHLMQREATDAPAVEGLRTKCSDLEATVALLQEENAHLLKAQSKSHPSSVEKLLRLTRENQHFAVKLSEQENKSKALESTIMLLNKYLDREINTGGVENSLIDILDDISYIKRTTNSREAKELIGMTEKGLERINEPRFHDSGHPVLPQT